MDFDIAVGVLSGVGAAFCIAQIRKYVREKCTRKPLSHLKENVRIKDLAILVKSPNVALRRSAEQLLLDRAMKKSNLEFIGSSFYNGEIELLKAATVVGLLAKNADYRQRLVSSRMLLHLSHCLIYSFKHGYKTLAKMGSEDVRLQRIVSSALFDIICDDNSAKIELVHTDPLFVKILLSLMSASKNKEIMRWCLFLAHQLSICENLRKTMIENDAISIVSDMLLVNQGDPILMRLCLQMLVMYANASEEKEVNALNEMANHGVIIPTVVCLKADDHDLVYWAAALLHEYAVKGVQKPRICETPNIVKSLQNVLLTSESLLQRIILRIISFLCHGNMSFSTALLQCSSLIARLPICFASGDNDVVHWSVVVLHDILMSSGNYSPSSCKTAAEKVIAASDEMIKTLVPLTQRKDNILVRLVAEIIGFFCSVDSILNKVLSGGVVKAVLGFAQSEDSDLQFWASALLLNLTMTSDQVKEEIVKCGGLKALIELAISDSREPATASQAAKTLVMLGFVDKPMPIVIKCGSYQHGDFASIIVSGKDYCCNKPGINMVVMDFLKFKVTEITSFDTGHDKAAVEQLIDSIHMVNVGAIAFLATRGEVNYFMTDEAIDALKEIGLENYDFKTGELWAFVGQKHRNHGEQIIIQRGFDIVELQTVIWLGAFVCEQVRTNILLPLIDTLTSTPATSPISKVSELELLTILARHDEHKQVMAIASGFVEYMAELIWNMSSKTGDQLRANPIAVAHCIGAMKVIAAISIAKEYGERLVQSPVLSAVMSLLSSINELSITQQQSANCRHSNKAQVTVVEDTEGYCEPLNETFNKSAPSNPALFSTEDNGLVENRAKNPSEFTEDKNVDTDEQSQQAKTSDDFQELFASLARLAISTLYNCIRAFTAQDELREKLIKSGVLHMLWCTLLNSSDVTRKQVGLPVEVLINWFGCGNVQEKYTKDQVMELDSRVSTPALMLSGDGLEASNNNWTFESVRANFCVGRSMYLNTAHPNGWYYEVTILSTGIMQIGWQTDQCKYGPEKGVGVGDDVHSCAFDGARCKVWSGPPNEQQNNDYGREWQKREILSCLLSWDGEVSYWLDGVNQGVAFEAINMSSSWYPAVSLAMDQQCIFNFGNKPFRYNFPEGYVAACQVVSTSVKFLPRLSSCWTPNSGSMESIVEEDEEEDMERTSLTCLIDRPLSGLSSSSIDSISQSKDQIPLPETEEKEKISKVILEEQPANEESGDMSDSRLATPSSEHTLTMVSPSSTPVDTPVMTPSYSRETFGTCDRFSVDASSSPCTGLFQRKPDQKAAMVPCDTAQSLVSDQENVPCMYFEAELKHSPSRTKQMGFCDAVTKEKIFCQILDNTLLLPKAISSTVRQECFTAPDVLGCGIMLPAGVVIFTLDGVPTGQFYCLPSELLLSVQSVVPYTSCNRVRCNYGQRDFLFEAANIPEVRRAAANFLHDLLMSKLRT